jgi:acetyl esterase/lipase
MADRLHSDKRKCNLLCWPLQGPALSKALAAHGVPYKEVVYDHAAHGIGLGRGTAADGWLDEAAAFWEEQTK